MRTNQYRVLVAIDGEDWGTFDTFAGGEVSAEEVKYLPGGMEPEISLGGVTRTGNVTVTRLYRLKRDHARTRAVINRVGKLRAVVTKIPLDEDGNVFNASENDVYEGIVIRMTPPPTDSTANTPAFLEIEVSTAGGIA